MEGAWGLLGLPVPAYVAPDRYRRADTAGGGGEVREGRGRPAATCADPEDADDMPPVDDSLTSLLFEDYPLWFLRTMFECIEMTPNGSLFLSTIRGLSTSSSSSSSSSSTSSSSSSSTITASAADDAECRARVERQIADARRDRRAEAERRADVLALFGSAGLHEHNLLRAIEEEQRKKRSILIKQRRRQHVARFKSDLRRRMDAHRHEFEDGLAADLGLLRSCGVFLQRQDQAAGLLSPQEDIEAISPRARSSKVEEDEARRRTEEQRPECEGASQDGSSSPSAAHCWHFEQAAAVKEHERRRDNFKRELAEQMRALELRADEMCQELYDAQGYEPFCLTCHTPIIKPCECRHSALHPLG